MSETPRFSDQIRQAVAASDLTRYRICKTIGLPESSMSRFMAGRSGLSLDTLDKLAELLGLAVVVRRRRRKGGA
jgi:transcriptional regulator with XRE-family HTH domain